MQLCKVLLLLHPYLGVGGSGGCSLNTPMNLLHHKAENDRLARDVYCLNKEVQRLPIFDNILRQNHCILKCASAYLAVVQYLGRTLLHIAGCCSICDVLPVLC